jgi:hypothetical protein
MNLGKKSGVRKIRTSLESGPWLVAVAESRHVLNQSDTIDEDVLRHGAGGILVAEVLVVHPEQHLRVNGHVHERDLVSIARNGLQGDADEDTPARMRVRGGDAIDARLRRGWEIGSSCRRAHENDSDSRRRGRWPVRFITDWSDERDRDGNGDMPPVHTQALRAAAACCVPSEVSSAIDRPRPSTPGNSAAAVMFIRRSSARKSGLILCGMTIFLRWVGTFAAMQT